MPTLQKAGFFFFFLILHNHIFESLGFGGRTLGSLLRVDAEQWAGVSFLLQLIYKNGPAPICFIVSGCAGCSLQPVGKPVGS